MRTAVTCEGLLRAGDTRMEAAKKFLRAGDVERAHECLERAGELYGMAETAIQSGTQSVSGSGFHVVESPAPGKDVRRFEENDLEVPSFLRGRTRIYDLFEVGEHQTKGHTKNEYDIP